MKANEILAKFLIWRIKRVGTRNFVIFLSAVIGSLSGLAAVSLKASVHFIQHLLKSGFLPNYLYFIFPLIGILLTIILSIYIFRETLGHGITDIIYAIEKKSSLISRSKMYTRMITSAITVGFGGSVGLEAPIVVTGSAIGSNVSQFMHIDYNSRTILVGCGAAGAISAIFNSPIAGVIFCFEVIITDLTITGFIPLLIASVAGSIISMLLLGDDILFFFKLTESFKASDTPFYILLGIICGLSSLYFTRMMYKIEKKIEMIRNDIGRGLTGGILLGIIIIIFPPIYGEGYDMIKAILTGRESMLLNNNLFISEPGNMLVLIFFLLGIVLIKPVATSLTIGSGGSGGIFAPSLFLGGITGFLVALTINYITGSNIISTSNFALVGMSGVMSGVLHAPLTGIFLIAEITSGYTLIVPLMIVSAISFLTISYYEEYSLYTKNLIERGDYNPYDKDKQVLGIIQLEKLVETDHTTIEPEKKLIDLIRVVSKSKRNIFPVVNKDQELMGIITLDDIREIMFDEDAREKIEIRNLMHSPPDKVDIKESMQSVMRKFEKTGAWNLPVIEDGKYKGFLSKSTIFNAYRNNLRRKKFA
ncbi:MAG: chloride channel protein [Cyclobacteriaceae bacterium]|nr:chloride channel protein [Cyclobacteriaceae bacterium]